MSNCTFNKCSNAKKNLALITNYPKIMDILDHYWLNHNCQFFLGFFLFFPFFFFFTTDCMKKLKNVGRLFSNQFEVS